jgi:RNA polymerase sigma factor (sigma-70 family)
MSRHESFLGQCLPDLNTPSIVPRRREAVAAMMVAIAKLEPDQRTVVQRLFLDAEPIAEIARDMGRSEDAVRRLGSRAMEKLRGRWGTSRGS